MTGRQTCRIGGPAAETLARGGGGTVTAVRRGVVFVQMSDGSVLAVLPHESPIHPWAISVPADLADLHEGSRVRMGEGVLALGTAIVPLREARVVDLRMMDRPAALPIGSMQHVLRRADREPDGSFEPAYAGALAEYSGRGEPSALLRILGLGKGITPPGDDALIGLLAGLDMLGRALEEAEKERRELISHLLPELEEGTSVFSASMILAAADGQYAEPILGFLEEAAREDVMPASLDRSCTALLEYGHDSGASTLDGIRASFRRILSLQRGRTLDLSLET